MSRDEGAAPLPERQRTKRFYRTVSVYSHTEGFGIHLDANALKTPDRNMFVLAVRALAEAAAEEWRGQGTRIDPAGMPLTALVNTAIDRVSLAADAVRRDICSYAANDLICYRAETPGGLAERQKTHWDPILTWAASQIGVRFSLASGVMPVQQPPASLKRIAAELEPLQFLPLAAAHMVTSLTGSALLALSLAKGQLAADAVWDAAHVDEDWQIDNWGSDGQAQSRRAARRLEFEAAALVLNHSR